MPSEYSYIYTRLRIRSASSKNLRPQAVASKGGGYCQDPDLPGA
jgi:hypothetical protein